MAVEGPRVFLSNLPFAVDWKYLKDLFRDNNLSVRHVDIIEDPKTGRPKGNAVVLVRSRADLETAIDMFNDMEIDGRQIFVREDRDSKPAKGGGGKSWGDGGGKGGHQQSDGAGARPTSNRGPEPRREQRSRVDELEEWREERRGRARDARQEEAVSGGVRVIIEGLAPGSSWQRVKDLCRDAGLRTKHADMVDRDQGTAVVEFFDADIAATAIERLDRAEVDGNRITAWDEARGPPRRGGKGRGRGDGAGWGGRPDDRDRHGGKGHGGGQRGHAEEWGGDRRGGGKGVGSEPRQGPQKRAAVADEDPMLRRLFVENLAPDVDWKQIKDLFREHFDVKFTDVINVGGEAYGIAEFTTRADALEACMQFNGVLLGDMPVRLRQDRGEFTELRATKRQKTTPPASDPKKGRGGTTGEDYRHNQDARTQKGEKGGGKGGAGGGKGAPGPRVFVANLDFNIAWQELKDYMRQAGSVAFCNVLEDNDGRRKGCALVAYETEEECEVAIDTLNDTVLGSRAITVRMADERPPGGRR